MMGLVAWTKERLRQTEVCELQERQEELIEELARIQRRLSIIDRR